MANRIMQWLLTLAPYPPSSQSYADRQTDQTASPMAERCGPNGFGVFLSGPGCVCWPSRHQSGLERDCRAGEKGKQL